jgi:DNA polymerase
LSNLNKTYALENLRSAFISALPDEKRTMTFVDGNYDAKVFLVGEAPGAEEDKIGIPFVGRAGKTLNRMLKKANLDRSEVAVCNVVPFRPPNNDISTVTSGEFNMYNDLLIKIINIINPRVIVLLGGTAIKQFISDYQRIGEIRGRVKNIAGYRFIPSYHPAYCLRNPEMEKFVVQDLRLAKQIAR